MIKIKVYTDTTYKVTEVTQDVYTIIERKVIEQATENVELQIFLKEVSITLPKLMDCCITIAIYEEALQENINNIKQKTI
jgi:predicted nuclease with TOPRIM domain